ncbi:hypothetical protein PMAYCL1PPCAC_15892 [Pristionchus mayeri]|uniref:G protein-coupled receptor n=1 Tax=Pristionchus mayeri TaxID=1317129 RepID=A0AAN5CJS2_9BILA|nr:hypothetical protein PMAYCL1PPCAC_15892 [Pristionchus mayeri]
MPLLAHLFIYRLIATKWLANSYYGYGSDEETRAYVKPFLDSEFPGEGEEFIGALYYEDGSYRWSAILATMGFNLMMTIFLSVIVFCSFAIVAHFRNTNVEWSGKTKKLQQQLFNTLVIQVRERGKALIVVYFPCAGIINLPMLGFRMNVFPNLVSAALTIFPVIDAFIIMGGVKSYR